MYRWRELTDAERQETLKRRIQRGHPTHSPQHLDSGSGSYHVTAACFEHHPHIGYSIERMNLFTADLLNTLHAESDAVTAWALLPNHYHALVKTSRVLALIKALGQMHGRSSHAWNGEENTRGRQVWCKAAETIMKNDGHYFATINYIHHNPVKHRYTQRWTDWPWSSAAEWLAGRDRATAEEQWKRYPIQEYGIGWDDPEM